MSVFLFKRFATFVATLLVASVLVFAVLDLLPGNVAQVILGDTATPESLAALEKKLGLDRPALVRYTDWIGGLLQGPHRAEPFVRHAHRRADRRAPAGHTAAGGDGDGAHGGDRHLAPASSRRRARTRRAMSA